MKKLIAMVAAGFMVAATPVLADNFYVQGDLGYGAQTKDADTRDGNFVLGGAVGYDFGAVRAEVGLTNFGQGNNAGGRVGRVDGQVYGVNAYVEPVTYAGFTPFATAGVGYGVFNGAGVNKAKDDGVVFNVGGGVSYAVSDKFDLVGTYRYFISDEDVARQNNGSYDNFRQHVFTAGARYKF